MFESKMGARREESGEGDDVKVLDPPMHGWRLQYCVITSIS